MKKLIIIFVTILFNSCSPSYQVFNVIQDNKIKKSTVVDLSQFIGISSNGAYYAKDSSTFKQLCIVMNKNNCSYSLLYKKNYIPRYFDDPLGSYGKIVNLFEKNSGKIKFGFTKDFTKYSNKIPDSCNYILVRKR